MAKKKKKGTMLDPGSGELDMTPMIDIVFNLMIFFMVVSEISKLNIEQLELPVASQASEKEPPTTDHKMVVNILQDGQIRISGATFKQGKLLDDYVDREARQAGFEEPNPNNPDLLPSRLIVTVRADKGCEWQYVQHFFEAAQKAGIYKISMGATKEKVSSE